METTFILAQTFTCSPFEIFRQDTDEVIAVINHIIEKGKRAPSQTASNALSTGKEQRIKVNDKTASGGWF